MKMHFLSGGRLQMRRNVYYPDAARDETFELPVISVLIRHPQGNLLFDTGCHPGVATDAAARWGNLAKVMRPVFRAETSLPRQLHEANLAASDIDIVVCSHLHADHCGCNTFFPQATLICHAAELEAARGPDASAQGFLESEWNHGGPIETFDRQEDLFGDGSLTLIPLPGHTIGMSVAHVVLPGSGAFLLASDAAPNADNLRTRHVPRNSWNPDKTLEALNEIQRFSDDGATVIFGHDAAQWDALPKGEAFLG